MGLSYRAALLAVTGLVGFLLNRTWNHWSIRSSSFHEAKLGVVEVFKLPKIGDTVDMSKSGVRLRSNIYVKRSLREVICTTRDDVSTIDRFVLMPYGK
jgi:hypothetical protein